MYVRVTSKYGLVGIPVRSCIQSVCFVVTPEYTTCSQMCAVKCRLLMSRAKRICLYVTITYVYMDGWHTLSVGISMVAITSLYNGSCW